MKTTLILIKRNIKLFFKDKAVFFTSLITPLILLVLYSVFLGKVFKEGYESIISSQGIAIDTLDNVINGLVSGQLISSLLAVCTITVAFCSNMIMVQDKANGTIDDINITPVNKSKLAISYYVATFINTLIVCLVGLIASLIFIAIEGWYLSFIDVLLILLDTFILTLFGTALSSLINHFLHTQGQISAVGTIVSSVYGFICGAYMPISNFPVGLQKVISFLPGTYGTSLLRAHALSGPLDALVEKLNPIVPNGAAEGIADAIFEMSDAKIYFFDHLVTDLAKYLFLGGFTIALILLYVLLNVLRNKKARKGN